MRLKQFLSVLLLIDIVRLFPLNIGDNSKLEISKIGFGSCYNYFGPKRMDIFNTINSLNPDMFIWLGDVTYLDDINLDIIIGKEPIFNKTESERRFNETFDNPGYTILREKVPVIGIWDDHDFQYNNAQGDASNKEDTKELFLNFLEENKNSIRRVKDNTIQASYSFGTGHKSFKVILPDLRFYKTKESLMTVSQWEWLENELKSDETFTIIGSGIQFLPFDRNIWLEVWSPKDREIFVNLLHKLKKSGVVFISGDIHCGQLMRTYCVHPSKYLYLILLFRNRIQYL
jgi:alkaline phosphatase D